MSPRDDLQYLTFSDFTPGIQQRLQNPGNEAGTGFTPNPGVASVENTYRCIALPGGGLGPLPKQTTTYAQSSLESSGTIFNSRYYISGFNVWGPVNVFTGFVSGSEEIRHGKEMGFDGRAQDGKDPVEFFMAFEYGHDSGGGSTWTRKWSVHRTHWFESSPSQIEIDSAASSGTGISADTIFSPTMIEPIISVGDTGASGARAATDPGSPTMLIGWALTRRDESEAEAELAKSIIYPDVSNDTQLKAGTPLDLTSHVGSLTTMYYHQNRIIAITLNQHHLGEDPPPAALIADQVLKWSKVNEVDTDASAQYAHEIVWSGIGAIFSQNASDLFIVGHRNGAALIQGDLNNPTVRVMRGVTPTAGVRTLPAPTPLGVAYGVNFGGIEIWQGSDGSEKISQQLEDDFWRIGETDFAWFGGTFDYWGQERALLVPNNFLFNVDMGSWWRLEDPTVAEIFHWRASPAGNSLFGAPYFIDHDTETDQDAVYVWERDQRATSWSWQSHPLFPLQTRYVTPRQVRVLAQGTGTITLTINDDTTNQISLSVADDDHAVFLRDNIPGDVASDRIRLRIESSGSGGGAAPVVYSVDIGYRPSRTKELAN